MHSAEPSRRLRVGLLSSWASRLGGGVFEAVRQHALGLSAHGEVDVQVFALKDQRTEDDREAWGPVPVSVYDQMGPRVFGYAPSLSAALRDADLDVLHLHGLWMFPSAAGAAWRARTQRPYIISPHGMLEPWILSRGRWKKALASRGYEHRNWRAASAFHALTPAEERDIAAALQPLDVAAPIFTVPNGVTIPATAPTRSHEPGHVLYLGRIHPKKNLEALIEAWHLRGGVAEARLTIAGWGEPAHVAQLEAKLASVADPSIRFVGSAYGAEKQALLSGAAFLILPSFSEGLPMTVLEAWAQGTPSIMTAACNLDEGFAQGSALETTTTREGISAALDMALRLSPDTWNRMSSAARRLVRDRYASGIVTRRWIETYQDLSTLVFEREEGGA